MQMAVPKDRRASESFYKNVDMKKNTNTNEKVRPNTGLQHAHLLHGNASAHKSSTKHKF